MRSPRIPGAFRSASEYERRGHGSRRRDQFVLGHNPASSAPKSQSVARSFADSRPRVSFAADMPGEKHAATRASGP